MNREEVIKKRYIDPKDFYGKTHNNPGIFVKDKINEIFSSIYKDFQEEFKIKKILFDDYMFVVKLISNYTNKLFELQIKDNLGEKSCNGKLCTSNLCTGVHYIPSDENFTKFLLYFQKKGEKIYFLDLLNILSKDFKTKKDYYQIFWNSQNPFFSIVKDWGHPIHKIRFITPEGVLREMDKSLDINVSKVHLQHSELECKSIRPDLEINKSFNFFSYPKNVDEYNFDKYFYLTNEEKNNLFEVKSREGIELFTDLDEEDIVNGKGNEKLKESLNTIKEYEKSCEINMLTFNCCCVPRVVGDDVSSILKNFSKDSDIPINHSGQLEKTPFEQKVKLLETYINKIDIEKISIDEKSVVFLGYRENKYIKYLSDLLIMNNVKIKAFLVPNIDIELLHKLYEASVFVFSDNKYQEEIFEYPFKNMGKDYIAPKYPFGIENTKNWMEKILNSLGVNYIFSEEEKNLIDNYYIKANYIKEKGYRIGLIFTGTTQLLNFLDSNYTDNIDIVEFLEEMGFGINFYIFDSFDQYINSKKGNYFSQEEGNYEKAYSIIKNKVNNLSNHNIEFFSNEKQMYKYLYNSDVKLIYSDIFYEDRFYKMGINFFNIRDFKEGYMGGLETIDRFIKLIEIDYFRKFGMYFN